jgi:hypothetical protein
LFFSLFLKGSDNFPLSHLKATFEWYTEGRLGSSFFALDTCMTGHINPHNLLETRSCNAVHPLGLIIPPFNLARHAL